MMKNAKVMKRNSDGTYVLGCDSDGCAGCKSRLFCTQKDTSFLAQSDCDCDFAQNDSVSIRLASSKTIASVAIVFVLPLFFMGGAMAICRLCGCSGGIQALFSMLGLAMGMLVSALISRFLSNRLLPVIVGRASQEP